MSVGKNVLLVNGFILSLSLHHFDSDIDDDGHCLYFVFRFIIEQYWEGGESLLNYHSINISNRNRYKSAMMKAWCDDQQREGAEKASSSSSTSSVTEQRSHINTASSASQQRQRDSKLKVLPNGMNSTIRRVLASGFPCGCPQTVKESLTQIDSLPFSAPTLLALGLGSRNSGVSSLGRRRLVLPRQNPRHGS